jgi:hypothetical protein
MQNLVKFLWTQGRDAALTPEMVAGFLTLPPNMQKMLNLLWTAGRNSIL